MKNLIHSPAWLNLMDQQKIIADIHMRDLFADDPGRFEKFSILFNDILFDFSKHRITEETLRLLINLAVEMDIKNWIKKCSAAWLSTSLKIAPSSIHQFYVQEYS
jgi:glucose-6-phosphate isomerase